MMMMKMMDDGWSEGACSVEKRVGVADGDLILWLRWDKLRDHSESLLARRLLFLGYLVGLQIWDCTSLGSILEILNLLGSDWEHVIFVGVLHASPLTLSCCSRRL